MTRRIACQGITRYHIFRSNWPLRSPCPSCCARSLHIAFPATSQYTSIRWRLVCLLQAIASAGIEWSSKRLGRIQERVYYIAFKRLRWLWIKRVKAAWGSPNVVSLKFLEEQPQIPIRLRSVQAFNSPPPNSTPKSRDRSLGTLVLKSVWGRVSSL